MKEHIPRLDVIRALAFLLVFVFHFGARTPQFILPWNGYYVNYGAWPTLSWPLLWMPWGWLGVALFFVLSGFCIHLSYLHQSKPFTIKDFYWRRFLRIYPAYFLAMIVCFALMPWLQSPYKHAYQLLPHLLLIHNLFKCTFLGINGVFWSLGVEVQFYLLYPLLLRLRERIGIAGCACAALILNIILQLYLTLSRNVIDSPISSTWSFPLVTWCDWILGACAAEAFVEGRSMFKHKFFFMFLSLFLLLMALNYKPIWVQSFLFASVFCTVVMEHYLSWKTPVSFLERLLIPIGLVSYSLYLWHIPVIELLRDFGDWLGLPSTPLAMSLIYLPATILCLTPLVIASYYWVELGVPRYFSRSLKRGEV